MATVGVLAAILLISVVFGVSDASPELRLRGLLDEGSKGEKPSPPKDLLPPPVPVTQPKGDIFDPNQKPPPPSEPKKSTDPPPPSPESGKSNPANIANQPPPPPTAVDDYKTIPKGRSSPTTDPKNDGKTIQDPPDPTPPPADKQTKDPPDPLPPPRDMQIKDPPPPDKQAKDPHDSLPRRPLDKETKLAPPGKQTNLAPPVGPESKDKHTSGSGDDGKKDRSEKASDKGAGPQEETCQGVPENCAATGMVACLLYPGNDSGGSFILIQNTGTSLLAVDITAPPSINIDTKMLELHKQQHKKIRFSTSAAESTKIVLWMKKEKCVLQTRVNISWNLIQQIPAYAAQVTPIHGLYFLFFTLLIGGGAWACCKFGRKGRTDGGVAYQQLEMGVQPQTASADVHTNAAYGWEQGWDDDWDEEAVVRSPAKQAARSVSANGLTSRTNKDGWDVDWDD